MKSYKTTTEMKASARELLLDKYGTYIGATVIVELILFIVMKIVSFAIPTTPIWGDILDILISFIINLISSVFTLGVTYFTLNICRNQPYKIGDVFHGFFTHPDKAIICRFLFSVAELICMLPALLFLLMYYINKNVLLLIPAALLGVVGIYFLVYLHLTYDFVYYVMLDYPTAGVKQLFAYCRDVMRGHRVKLFYLLASFLPMIALGILSSGIGLLFIIPYQNVTFAQFYLDIFYPENENETI